MAQALTVEAPSLRPTVSSTNRAVPVVPVCFRMTRVECSAIVLQYLTLLVGSSDP